MVAVLHTNAHLLQCEDRLAAQVRAGVQGRQVDVAALVEHGGVVGGLEIEELKLRADVERVPQIGGPLEIAL